MPGLRADSSGGFLMALTGDLGNLGLADLLQTGLTGQGAGVLQLRDGASRAALYVSAEGLMVLEPESLDTEDLIHAFTMRGVVTAEAVKLARTEFGDGEALLDALLDSGQLPKQDVNLLISSAAHDTVIDLLTWNTGEFSFEERELDESKLGLLGRVLVDPTGLLLRAAQRLDERRQINTSLGRHASLFVVTPGEEPPAPEDEEDPISGVHACLDGHALIGEIALFLGISRFRALRAAHILVESGAARLAQPEEMQRAAEVRANGGDFRGARRLLLQWSEVEPGNEIPVQALVNIAKQSGDLKGELASLLALGSVQLHGGRASAAVDTLNIALDRDPQSLTILRARQQAAEVAGNNEVYNDSTIRLARRAMDSEEPERAVEILAPIVARDPNNLAARLRYAHALLRARNTEELAVQAKQVARLIGKTCSNRDERELAMFFRDSLQEVAPNETATLNHFRALLAPPVGRRRRVAIAAALVTLLGAAGVVLWPKSPTKLLDNARAAAQSGRTGEAREIIAKIIEEYPESVEAEEAWLLQARIVNPDLGQSKRAKISPEFTTRLKQAATELAPLLPDLPKAEVSKKMTSLLDSIDITELRTVLPKRLASVAGTARNNAFRMERDAAKRMDTLQRIREAPRLLKNDPRSLERLIHEAEGVRDPAYPENLLGATEILQRLADLADHDALRSATAKLGTSSKVLRDMATTIESDVSECRRIVINHDLATAERRCRERGPELMVNGDLEEADSVYKEFETILGRAAEDPTFASLWIALQRRGIPNWVKGRRSRIAEIRRNIDVARGLEEQGNLEGAAQAYVNLIRKYMFVRFEQVFTLPLKVETSPRGATLHVNGQEVGKSPMIIRYGWGQNTSVKVSAPGFSPQSVLVETAAEKPVTKLRVRLIPETSWKQPISKRVAFPVTDFGRHVATAERSGRISLHDAETGNVLWSVSHSGVEGLRSSPVATPQGLVVAYVSGNVDILSQRDGSKVNTIRCDRPIGKLASMGSSVALVSSKGTLYVIGARAIDKQVSLGVQPSTGPAYGHGALWVGTGSGKIVRVKAHSGSKTIINPKGNDSSIRDIVTGPSGALAVTHNGTLISIAEDGRVRWVKAGIGDLVGAPAEAGHVAAVSDRRGRVFLFNMRDGSPRTVAELGGVSQGGLLGTSGHFIAHRADGRLWVYNAHEQRVSIEADLGGSPTFAPSLLSGSRLAASAEGEKLMVLKLPMAK